MRKFRGKNKNNNEWAYGGYVFSKNQHTHDGIIEDIHFIMTTDMVLVQVHPESVGQFTGLRDKNGVDLDWWNGDILENIDRRLIIKWDEEQGLWRLYTPFGSRTITLYKARLHHWIKIGNIHENKELLND